MLRYAYKGLVLAALSVVARSQSFPDKSVLPGCGGTCLDSLLSQSSTFNCPDGSAACLCGSVSFQDGVRDCASGSCATDLFPSVTNYIASVCATAAAAIVPPATASVALSTATLDALPTPSTTVAEAAPTSTEADAATTPIPSTTPNTSTPGPLSSGTTETTTASISLASVSSIPTSIASSSSTLKSSAAVTQPDSTSASASATSSSEAVTSADTLSVGAKAGIGIGAAVGAVAAIGAAVACVISSKHKRRSIHEGARSYQISEPMPGAGRVYANENSSQGFEPVSELEMKSRRYEDMVPRHVPRNMV